MEMRKVTAIVRRVALGEIEKRLQQEGVPGITVSPVKGYGEYADYFSENLMVPHVKIEIFVPDRDVDRVVEAIVGSAHTGVAGDGLVAVTPVLRMVKIRTRREFGAGEA